MSNVVKHHSLTSTSGVATMVIAGTSSTGRENPYMAKKSPQPLAAFLCLPFFSAALSRLFTMTGCSGQRSALAAPCSGFSLHCTPSPDTVRSISGGYPLYMETVNMTPKNHQVSEQNRPHSQYKTNDLPLMVSCFRVVIDQDMADGSTRLLQRSLLPSFRKLKAAKDFLDKCTVPNTYGVTHSYFFRNKALAFEALLFSVQ
jgi:hypothetical protein